MHFSKGPHTILTITSNNTDHIFHTKNWEIAYPEISKPFQGHLNEQSHTFVLLLSFGR